jgi:hypothetical protein
MSFQFPRPGDNELIDDDWLRSEGYKVHLTNGVVISLDGKDAQLGTVLVRTCDGWMIDSPWPEYESVLLPYQPKTRGELRWVISSFKAEPLLRLISEMRRGDFDKPHYFAAAAIAATNVPVSFVRALASASGPVC